MRDTSTYEVVTEAGETIGTAKETPRGWRFWTKGGHAFEPEASQRDLRNTIEIACHGVVRFVPINTCCARCGNPSDRHYCADCA